MTISNAGFVRFFTNGLALETSLRSFHISSDAFNSRLNSLPNHWADLQQPYANPVSLNAIEYLPISANNTGSYTMWQPNIEMEKGTIPVGKSLIIDDLTAYEDTPSYCKEKLNWNETRKSQALAHPTNHAATDTLMGWCTRVLLATPVGLQPRLLSQQALAPVMYLRGISTEQAQGDFSQWWRYRPDAVVIGGPDQITQPLMISVGTNSLISPKAEKIPPDLFCKNVVDQLQKTIARLLGLPQHLLDPNADITAKDLKNHFNSSTTQKNAVQALNYSKLKQFFNSTAPAFCQQIGQGVSQASGNSKGKNLSAIILPSVLVPVALASFLIVCCALRERCSLGQPRLHRTERPNTYESDPSADANTIERNLKHILKLNKTPLISVNSAVKAILNTNSAELQLTEMQRGRLVDITSSNCDQELQLVWTYLDTQKKGDDCSTLKRQFTDYLAKTNGCLHGRKNQVLLFFLGGIDTAILKSPNASLIKKVPATENAKNNIMASMLATLTQAQRHNHLPVESTRHDEALFLKKIFVEGQAYDQYLTDIKMTEKVFDRLFTDMQQGIEMQEV